MTEAVQVTLTVREIQMLKTLLLCEITKPELHNRATRLWGKLNRAVPSAKPKATKPKKVRIMQQRDKPEPFPPQYWW